ncbi:MAG: exodeoxyribonuclease VII large subunit [Burkholderiales bacterium]|nr:exodeoxyribonuclease VII large subunit [Burkholderiales bacterium]
MTGDLFAPRPAPRPAVRDAPTPSAGPVLTVSVLVAHARLAVERALGLAWVSGEISGFSRAASGHCYFSLKDAQAQVRCVLYRTRAQHVDFALRDGLHVEVRATPTIYEVRGEFQLSIDVVRLSGVGALYERFARQKARLEAAGWFAAERKRALPAYPRGIGIVTSPQAAALRDILATLARRWPSVRVVVYPTPVQGAGVAAQIAQAIDMANARAEVDVLIVARGGGSIEDLWAFNEEPVARAVYMSRLPVVSGVGHETDFTICDFVADVRAPTPTGAAMLVVPDRVALGQRLVPVARSLASAASRRLQTGEERLDRALRGLVHPAARIATQAARVAELAARLDRTTRHAHAQRAHRAATAQLRFARELRTPLPGAVAIERLVPAFERGMRAHLDVATRRLDALAQSLGHLDPDAVLTRGYAYVTTASGAIVVDARQVSAGERVALTFARGGAQARVETVRSEER